MSRSLKNKSRLFLGLVSAPAKLDTAKFVFYYGPALNDSETFELPEAQRIVQHQKFDLNKKTVLYIHGYIENLEEESVKVVVGAYLERNDYNVIALDWSDLAEGNFLFDAVVNTKQFGPELAKILLQMFDAGLNIEKFHLVGHSLGGQLSGIVGREIISRTNGNMKIPRITALDPAFPGFYLVKFGTPLNKGDAKFVDVIHTDAWFYGAPFSTGTADFWPNGGKTLQPGCPKRNYKLLTDNDLSSHRRSWWFWAESVARKYEEEFNAIKAKSWSDFKQGKTEDLQQEVVMGNNCPVIISGDFYLQTNGTPPYARGLLGKKFVEESKNLKVENGNSEEVS